MNTKQKIIIIGGKGTAVVIADQLIDAIRKYDAPIELLGFAFDDEMIGPDINGIPIVEKTRQVYTKFEKNKDVQFIFSLYRPDLMRERSALRDSYGIPIERFATFVHPLAYVAPSAIIGPGTVVLAQSVVNSNARIGTHNTLNSGVLIGHDSMTGGNCFLSGHCAVGSNISVGEGVFIGLNSSLKNFITVGDYSIVGMASNVVKNVPAGSVVYGNPAVDRLGLHNPIR